MLRNLIVPAEDSTTTKPRRVNRRQEYLHLAVIGMSALWLAPWAAITLKLVLDITLTAALGLCVVHLLPSMVVTRWMHHRRMNANRQMALSLVLMGMAAGITVAATPALAAVHNGEGELTLAVLFDFEGGTRFPAGPVVLLWVFWLWWRGSYLGQSYITLVRASFGLRLGILGFILALLFGQHMLRTNILTLVPFFFFFGLIATSLARANSLYLDRPHQRTVFGRGWLVSLISIALLLTLFGHLLATSLVGVETDAIRAVTREVGEGAAMAAGLIAAPILLASQKAFEVADKAMPDEMPETRITIGESSDREPQPDDSTGDESSLIQDIMAVVRNVLIGIIMVIMGLIVLAFFWFLFLMRRANESLEGEERENIGTSEVVGNLRQQLRDGWRRLTDALGLFRQFGLGRELFAAMTIRRLYARMERLAGKRGYPRVSSETPYEYRHDLRRAFPDCDADIQRITEAYIAVRYGDVPEDPRVLEGVRAAWEHIQESPNPA
jgi:hypothetical protein